MIGLPIGAYYNDGTGSNAGHVRIYQYASVLSLNGLNIDREAADDRFGYSVSMNSAGDRVAIGANKNDGTASDAGHVRVYEYASKVSWSKLGSDIDGEAGSDQSGWSVSMNSAGDRVAIGAYYNDGFLDPTQVTCASTNTPPVLGHSSAVTLMGKQLVTILALLSP